MALFERTLFASQQKQHLDAADKKGVEGAEESTWEGVLHYNVISAIPITSLKIKLGTHTAPTPPSSVLYFEGYMCV